MHHSFAVLSCECHSRNLDDLQSLASQPALASPKHGIFFQPFQWKANDSRITNFPLISWIINDNHNMMMSQACQTAVSNSLESGLAHFRLKLAQGYIMIHHYRCNLPLALQCCGLFAPWQSWDWSWLATSATSGPKRFAASRTAAPAISKLIQPVRPPSLFGAVFHCKWTMICKL